MRVNERMKKLLSIVLTLCMILSYIPAPAYAVGTDCTHHTEHTAECGYVAAVEGHECHYECAECAIDPANEELGDEAPVCTCEAAEGEAHTEGCALYAAPAEPVCTCAEACTTENFNEYCDVCGVDYSKCTGTDTAVQYDGGAIDLSTLTETYLISDSGEYTFTGTGSYGIKVESGNPTIILNNVSITVGKEWDNENIVNAIDIVADNSETTVWITGTNNLTSNSGAGIYVKSGSTVIIKSDSRDNILTARAGMDGAGIGGTGYDFSYENVTCGNIYIENITVNAYSSGYMSSNPGIGAITSCGTITIKNATVTALGSNQGGVLYGGEFCPAIGASTVPDIVIENSTINAYRGDSKDGGTGSLADWIGAVIIYDPYSGDTPHTPGIQCGNGYIISTTVNKFLYKVSTGVTKEEGSVTYDADGNPTEQTAE